VQGEYATKKSVSTLETYFPDHEKIREIRKTGMNLVSTVHYVRQWDINNLVIFLTVAKNIFLKRERKATNLLMMTYGY
jgi:hypothetical protein